MFKKIKKLALASVAGIVLALSIGWLPGQLFAVYNQYQATKYNDVTVANLLVRDAGIYDSAGVLRVPLSTTSLSLVRTSATVAVSTTATSGTSTGDQFTAFLASGPASGSGVSIPAIEGSVLCSTTSQQGNQVTVVVCVNTLNLGSVIGIAASAASTGTVVNLYSTGWVLARTTGTVAAGDSLSTSSLASGYFQTSGSSATAAIALGAGNANGGLTRVKIVR